LIAYYERMRFIRLHIGKMFRQFFPFMKVA
jgi:hypothetical protein